MLGVRPRLRNDSRRRVSGFHLPQRLCTLVVLNHQPRATGPILEHVIRHAATTPLVLNAGGRAPVPLTNRFHALPDPTQLACPHDALGSPQRNRIGLGGYVVRRLDGETLYPIRSFGVNVWSFDLVEPRAVFRRKAAVTSHRLALRPGRLVVCDGFPSETHLSTFRPTFCCDHPMAIALNSMTRGFGVLAACASSGVASPMRTRYSPTICSISRTCNCRGTAFRASSRSRRASSARRLTLGLLRQSTVLGLKEGPPGVNRFRQSSACPFQALLLAVFANPSTPSDTRRAQGLGGDAKAGTIMWWNPERVANEILKRFIVKPTLFGKQAEHALKLRSCHFYLIVSWPGACRRTDCSFWGDRASSRTRPPRPHTHPRVGA